MSPELQSQAGSLRSESECHGSFSGSLISLSMNGYEVAATIFYSQCQLKKKIALLLHHSCVFNNSTNVC